MTEFQHVCPGTCTDDRLLAATGGKQSAGRLCDYCNTDSKEPQVEADISLRRHQRPVLTCHQFDFHSTPAHAHVSLSKQQSATTASTKNLVVAQTVPRRVIPNGPSAPDRRPGRREGALAGPRPAGRCARHPLAGRRRRPIVSRRGGAPPCHRSAGPGSRAAAAAAPRRGAGGTAGSAPRRRRKGAEARAAERGRAWQRLVLAVSLPTGEGSEPIPGGCWRASEAVRGG